MLLPTTNTVSARDVQRNYRKIVERVKKKNQPVVVIRKNQPEVAIVSLDILAEYKELKTSTFDWTIVDRIRALNADKDPDEVYKEVTEEVEKVRQERYDAEQKAHGRR